MRKFDQALKKTTVSDLREKILGSSNSPLHVEEEEIYEDKKIFLKKIDGFIQSFIEQCSILNFRAFLLILSEQKLKGLSQFSLEKMICSFERYQKQSREIILLMFFLLNDSPNLDQLKKFSLIKKKITSIVGNQFYFILDSVCLDFDIWSAIISKIYSPSESLDKIKSVHEILATEDAMLNTSSKLKETQGFLSEFKNFTLYGKNSKSSINAFRLLEVLLSFNFSNVIKEAHKSPSKSPINNESERKDQDYKVDKAVVLPIKNNDNHSYNKRKDSNIHIDSHQKSLKAADKSDTDTKSVSPIKDKSFYKWCPPNSPELKYEEIKNYSKIILAKQEDQVNLWSSASKNKVISTFSNSPQSAKYFIKNHEVVTETKIHGKPKLNKSIDTLVNKDQHLVGILTERRHLKKELSNRIQCLREHQDKIGKLQDLYQNLSDSYAEFAKNYSQKEEKKGQEIIFEKNLAKKERLDDLFKEVCLNRRDKLNMNKSFLSDFLKTSSNKFEINKIN